jgi:hypothetical protein
MVTYSSRDKKISGDECAASTAVKPEYHQYVIDLADHLGATFSAMKSKSTELGVKYRLRNIAQSLEKLETSGYTSDSYFKFIANGEVFYTNGYMVISKDELQKAQTMIEKGELKVPYPRENVFETVLLSSNHDSLENAGIHPTIMYDFVGGD